LAEEMEKERFSMKQKLQRFMAGRYGADQLSRILLGASIVCCVISLFSRLNLFYLLAIGLLAYTYFRMFSRNISKRYNENQRFLNWKYRLVVKKDRKKKEFSQRKEYRFFRCPKCRQKVRVPRGKGKICISCPKCKEEFIKRS
jgi:ribosomal protein L37AE/L43A